MLRNVAQVSKRFHRLSEDPHVIRKIEVDPDQYWPNEKREKNCHDFLRVLKRCLKLRSLSFAFSWDADNDKPGEMWVTNYFLKILTFSKISLTFQNFGGKIRSVDPKTRPNMVWKILILQHYRQFSQ